MGRRDTQAKYFLNDGDHAVHILEQLQNFSVKSRRNKSFNEIRGKFNTSASGMIRDPRSHDFSASSGLGRRGSGLILEHHRGNDFPRVEKQKALA